MKIIRKVWKRNKTNQLMITIPNKPNKFGIKEGDYVEVKKVE